MQATKVCTSHGMPFQEWVNICFKEKVEQIETDPRLWQTVVKPNISLSWYILTPFIGQWPIPILHSLLGTVCCGTGYIDSWSCSCWSIREEKYIWKVGIYSIENFVMSTLGCGYFNFMLFNVLMTIWATIQLRNHFEFAGIIYQGAYLVLQIPKTFS